MGYNLMVLRTIKNLCPKCETAGLRVVYFSGAPHISVGVVPIGLESRWILTEIFIKGS